MASEAATDGLSFSKRRVFAHTRQRKARTLRTRSQLRPSINVLPVGTNTAVPESLAMAVGSVGYI